MSFAHEELIHAHYGGRSVALRRAATHSLSRYGGPSEADVEGIALPTALHHIATIDARHLRGLGVPREFGNVPLYFGLAYNDCELRYAFDTDWIRVESIQPEHATEDWPYAGFPQLLPFTPLEVAASREETWREFRARCPNLDTDAPTALIVLVPPPATLGFSMWGRWGDAEDVTIVFECELDVQRITARTHCT